MSDWVLPWLFCLFLGRFADIYQCNSGHVWNDSEHLFICTTAILLWHISVSWRSYRLYCILLERGMQDRDVIQNIDKSKLVGLKTAPLLWYPAKTWLILQVFIRIISSAHLHKGLPGIYQKQFRYNLYTLIHIQLVCFSIQIDKLVWNQECKKTKYYLWQF